MSQSTYLLDNELNVCMYTHSQLNTLLYRLMLYDLCIINIEHQMTSEYLDTWDYILVLLTH